MSLSNLLPNTDDDGDHDDQPVAETSRDMLVQACLMAALTRRGRRILSSPAGGVIFMVPTAGYAEPVKRALRRLAKDLLIHCVTEKRRAASYSSELDFAALFQLGRPVIVVSQNEDLIPPAVHAAADVTVTLMPPTAAAVRTVIRRVTGGSVRGLSDADLAGRDLDEIAAAIRPGSSSNECLMRLKRRRHAPDSELDRTPSLEVLPVFGEARRWADDLLADIERVRRGEIDPGELEGALLFGPPGTGKTLLARSLAKTAGLPFLATSVPQWFTAGDGHLDNVLKAAEAFFQKLIEAAPSVGLLDELEAIPDRETIDSRYREYWNAVVAGVLLMVTRVRDSQRGVILIGATNYIDRVDAALKRPGRMGRYVLVRPPETTEEVILLFGFYLGADLPNADLSLAADMAGEATPAQVEAWAKSARRRAREAGRALVVDDVIAEIAPPDKRSDEELYGAAVHEAGHAVAALALGFDLASVSIVAADHAGGVTRFRGKSSSPRLSEVEDHVVVTLAGRAADHLLGAGADMGAQLDLEQATRALVAARASQGLRETLAYRGDELALSSLLRLDPALLRQVEADLQRLMMRALDLVGSNKPKIEALANGLMVRRVLPGSEVSRMLGAHAASPAADSSRGQGGEPGPSSPSPIEADEDLSRAGGAK